MQISIQGKIAPQTNSNSKKYFPSNATTSECDEKRQCEGRRNQRLALTQIQSEDQCRCVKKPGSLRGKKPSRQQSQRQRKHQQAQWPRISHHRPAPQATVKSEPQTGDDTANHTQRFFLMRGKIFETGNAFCCQNSDA